MFNIDKQKFGTFIAMLRKEKGMTQKELAERLFISDKAVSKWETGASIPSIDLLMPLADILGVTATELLMCQRMEQEDTLSTTQVEQVVKTAISYSEEKQTRAYRNKGKWGLIYILSLIISGLEIWFSYKKGCAMIGGTVVTGLAAAFGIYFCFFVKEKLPAYYDENHICLYTDGIFEMNLPGLTFNNNNWGKILKVCRIWAISLMVLYPIISYMEGWLLGGFLADMTDLFLSLFCVLVGLFLPVYIVGKKFENKFSNID